MSLYIAGIVSGLCLFWNTETGLYVLASGFAGIVFFKGSAWKRISNVVVTTSSALATFLILSVIAYGPGVFQIPFFTGLFKPFTIYAAGLGGVPIVWAAPVNMLYAVLSPITGLATLGWSAAMSLRAENSIRCQTPVILFLLSVMGVCLMLKWVNMSIDALWHVNALPIVAVFGWWIRIGLKHLSKRLPLMKIRKIVQSLYGGLLLAVVLFLFFVQDGRNPSLYGLRAFLIYPSVLVATLKDMPHFEWAKGGEASSVDVDLIKQYTKPKERVTLISIQDWVFLLAADRPPKFPWLPTPTINVFPFLIDNALQDTGPIFLDGDVLDRELPDSPLRVAMVKYMRSGYVLRATGNRLKVYTR